MKFGNIFEEMEWSDYFESGIRLIFGLCITAMMVEVFNMPLFLEILLGILSFVWGALPLIEAIKLIRMIREEE